MTIQSRKWPATANDPDARETAHPGTYQSLLDQALCMTFPASDPIAVGVAMQLKPKRPTGKDDHDWPLAPGGGPPVRLARRR